MSPPSGDSIDAVRAGSGGHRLTWDDLPSHVRAGLQARLGSPVVEASSQPGGFSPGFASRLLLQDGRRAFVKAVSASQNRESPGIYRQEARYAVALPPAVPAPRLLWTFDDGDWVALAFEDLDARTPQLPWQPAELQRVLAAIATLPAMLTPAPFEAPPLEDAFDRAFHGWRRLLGSPHADDPRLDPWAKANLARLAGLEATWASGVRGDTLLHSDLRADNILLTPDHVFFVDWPWVRIGAPWFDLLAMLPSVAMQGGGDPEEIFTNHPVGRTAGRDAVTAVICALTGYFIRSGLQPAPTGLPTLRPFQLAQGEAALAWLQRRLDW